MCDAGRQHTILVILSHYTNIIIYILFRSDIFHYIVGYSWPEEGQKNGLKGVTFARDLSDTSNCDYYKSLIAGSNGYYIQQL
jgi:hypothetical protein